MSIKDIVKLSERRVNRRISDYEYQLELARLFIQLESSADISRVAQALMLGIVPEGGDGE